MLDLHNPQQPVLYQDRDRSFDLSSLLSYFVGLLKRHFFLFALPFLIVTLLGVSTIKFMRPIYQAEGEILVESPKIAPDLIRPTITEFDDQRFALFQQRIMTPSNLLGVMNKFDLFPGQRASLSQFQLLDLMRSRLQIEPAKLAMRANNQSSTFALTVRFDYEVPDVALKVTNEFLTENSE